MTSNCYSQEDLGQAMIHAINQSKNEPVEDQSSGSNNSSNRQVSRRTTYSRQYSTPDSCLFKELENASPSGSGSSERFKDNAEAKHEPKAEQANDNGNQAEQDLIRVPPRRPRRQQSIARNDYVLRQIRKVNGTIQSIARKQRRLNRRLARIERQFDQEVIPSEY